MLNLKQVLAAKPKPHKDTKLTPLKSPWADSVTPDNVLSEHPNPQFERSSFISLNGTWSYALRDCPNSLAPYASKALRQAVLEAVRPQEFDGDILVPFSPESALSGVERQLMPDQLLWYSRSFDRPEMTSNDRLLLHFEAVDYVCACWCNGSLLGTHIGGYLPFTFDITNAIQEGTNELLVCVADPSEHGVQLRGKQRLDRGDIWYTAQSGIWQSVWMEAVPQAHLTGLRVSANPYNGMARIKLKAVNPDNLPVCASIIDQEGQVVVSGTVAFRSDDEEAVIALAVPQFQLWSPETPNLYYVQATLGDDFVYSYFAFRSVKVQRGDKGYARLFLNDKPVFLKGILDQGYWPESLMTAPNDEALIFDIQAAKDLGFNMIRKHIKIESRRWYYHADRLGMLVWQDMVSGGSPLESWHISYKPTLFQHSWSHFDDRSPKHQRALSAGDAAYQDEWAATCHGTVTMLKGHPSIVTWVLFNEGWGQFDARSATAAVQQIDSTRPIDSVSGWYDQGCGNYLSEHNYFRTLEAKPAQALDRAYVISEFGGLAWSVENHCALESEYGYSNYENSETWKAALKDALAQADALEKKGLAGYVYTQLTDVEEEVNGLLTYDRLPK